MSFVYISCIIVYYMIDTNQSGEKVGLAITQAMTLVGMLPWGIRQSAEVSNQMMSVERILEYRDLEAEKQPPKPCTVPSDWPSRGCIEFRNVIYKYFEEAEPVLRGLSFLVQPKEKIGNSFFNNVTSNSILNSFNHFKKELLAELELEKVQPLEHYSVWLVWMEKF